MNLKTFQITGVLFLSAVTGCMWDKVTPEFDCTLSNVEIELVDSANSSCDESNGAFTINATGGEPPYEFSTDIVSNVSGVFADLAAGNYSVTVTDANGCTNEINVSVENQDGVNLTEVQISDAGCGTSNGNIKIDTDGGSEPYIFTLNGAEQSVNTFTGLARGTYTVGVKDQSGCEIIQNVELLSGVSYQSSIKAIIENSCAISGCHNGSISPDLRTFGTIQSSASRIKARTANGSMPRGSTLSQTQIDLIACWVDDGALNN